MGDEGLGPSLAEMGWDGDGDGMGWDGIVPVDIPLAWEEEGKELAPTHWPSRQVIGGPMNLKPTSTSNPNVSTFDKFNSNHSTKSRRLFSFQESVKAKTVDSPD